MNFLEEITKLINMKEPIVLKDYRYVNIDGNYLYIEGITGILTMSIKEIGFNLKKKTIKIIGDDLTIKYFDNSTAIIEGRIIDVIVL